MREKRNADGDGYRDAVYRLPVFAEYPCLEVFYSSAIHLATFSTYAGSCLFFDRP